MILAMKKIGKVMCQLLLIPNQDIDPDSYRPGLVVRRVLDAGEDSFRRPIMLPPWGVSQDAAVQVQDELQHTDDKPVRRHKSQRAVGRLGKTRHILAQLEAECLGVH